MLWREVAARVQPRVLLTLNDLLPAGIARTLALRRAGCMTVEYEFSSHWRTDEHLWVPDYVYGFAVVDAMVSWGTMHSDHFRNHRGRFGEFWEVGCLWSEHARIVRDDPEINARYRGELDVPLDGYEHVVGVFDTSTASFFGYDDMAAFYAGVAELAPAFPRVLFLCKPKRPIEDVFANGVGGREVEAAFAATPNVVVVPEHFETAAVVAFSDLSINACYTSPAVETIGAGRPAVYFDPTDLFPTSFFRRIPDFVATNGEALASLVESQLTGDPRLSRFDALEGHYDGLAITRLRARLREELDR
jgi:polysaccharide biosynthesis PFTS motif protein